MKKRNGRVYPALLLGALCSLAFALPAQAGPSESVIIECKGSCSKAVSSVRKMGGTVTHRYDNIDAIAARVPAEKLSSLSSASGIDGAFKDALVANPAPTESAEILPAGAIDVISGAEAKTLAESQPDDYWFNNDLIGAFDLQFGQGIYGDGVIVAVIDSGVANNPALVPAIAGDVIGGENFVPGATEPSATSTLNGNHGTWVATNISADIFFLFGTGSTLVQSLLDHAPGSVIPEVLPGASAVPMWGVAPDADLYALKTFAAAGGGSPESRIIAAMDRAITLKKNFNAGMPSVPVSGTGTEDDPFVYDSLNIQVVNMSLGGPTLFAGRDLEDSLAMEMLDAGITLVASAGNEGHAAMTGGSPGTAIGTLTSGSMSTPAHERVLRDIQFGLGIGSLYRPSDHIQMATSSSRGPTADGRISTNAVSSGFATFAQGASGGISLVSGTSFSAPQIAGAAALLWEGSPGSSAVQIRNALEYTADPGLIGGNPQPIDQGGGVIDIPAALAALQAGDVDSKIDRGYARSSVEKNLKKAGFKVIDLGNDDDDSSSDDGGKAYRKRIKNLEPGEVEHIFLKSHKNTDSFTITFSNVDPELPPAEQNVFFGDDLYVKVQDAITSDEATVGGGYFLGDTTIQFDNPQTGIVRVAVMGDWTNAGRISTDIEITAETSDDDHSSDDVVNDRVEQGELDIVNFEMPAGASQAVFELAWDNNWGAYPTDDLDLYLIDPAGNWHFGATLDSPERVEVANPLPGTWEAWIDGFTVHGVIKRKPYSKYELVASADGKVIPPADEDDDSGSDDDSSSDD